MNEVKIKVLIIFCFLCIFILSGCSHFSDWTINGMDIQKFRQSTSKEKTMLAAGFGTSLLVHLGGHVAYYEIEGYDYRFDSLNEALDDRFIQGSDRAWAGRSGFIGQLLGGIILKYGPWGDSFKKGYFSTGYHIGTAAEIFPYPLIQMGDLKFIREGGGNADMEWAGYSILSAILLLDKKDNE